MRSSHLDFVSVFAFVSNKIKRTFNFTRNSNELQSTPNQLHCEELGDTKPTQKISFNLDLAAKSYTFLNVVHLNLQLNFISKENTPNLSRMGPTHPLLLCAFHLQVIIVQKKPISSNLGFEIAPKPSRSSSIRTHHCDRLHESHARLEWH